MTRAQSQDQQPKKRERKRRGRGEGSIYFDQSAGRWCATVSRGVDARGKRRRKKVTGATKKEVQDELGKLQQHQPLADTSKLKVSEFLTSWLSTCEQKMSTRGYERREGLVRLHLQPHLGHLRLAHFAKLHVQQFHADLFKAGVPSATRKDAAAVLVTALNHAVEMDLISFNPATGVKRPRHIGQEMKVYDEMQVRQLLEAARAGRWYALFALVLGSGMRQGELLALEWRDVDFDGATVSVRRSVSFTRAGPMLKEPKSAAGRRTITLPPFVMEALDQHRKRMLAKGFIDRPVFCSGAGSFLFPQTLRQWIFTPLLEKAGLPKVRFHDLRHTHASTLLSKGYSIRAISARLGHSKVEMTLRVYSHLLPNDDATLAKGLQALYG
ncbi:MAG: site-specific integrase [Planctomycetes bacterium]|nr:site-specific integrase [Planctomycetota bacterium]